MNTESVALLHAIATNGNASTIPFAAITYDSPFVPEPRDVWLNGLWFVSLGLTLSVALITGLIKQWLNFYIAETIGSPKQVACTRQFRYMGLSAWGVSLIIELLPLLMNASLFIFLIGLVLFLQGLNGTQEIQVAVVALTSTLFILYVVSGILPIWNPQCPYKSSLSQTINFGVRIVKFIAIRLLMSVLYHSSSSESSLLVTDLPLFAAGKIMSGSVKSISSSRKRKAHFRKRRSSSSDLLHSESLQCL